MAVFEFRGKPITGPENIRGLKEGDLPELAEAIRTYLRTIKTDKPSHLASSFGAIELITAIHYLFDTPEDRFLIDVGHQAYAHKLLSGRDLSRIRQWGGVSGFPAHKESPYDLFSSGHSSTSLSALAGLAVADQLAGKTNAHIAIIGDGAITAGMSFEALNFIGDQQIPLIIVLNDNGISIDENVGFLHKEERYADFFSSLGIEYGGPYDAHDFSVLLPRLKAAKDKKNGPCVLHFKSTFSRGYQKTSEKKHRQHLTYGLAIKNHLLQHMTEDERIVLVSPAMLSGAEWTELKDRFPKRVFDVGIAEQHALTYAAGFARAGYKPICHIYSSFFQRAWDQFIHDVAIQELGLILLIDRAGLVGEDGPTHHGIFDISASLSIPNTHLFAPSSPDSAVEILDQKLRDTAKGPVLIRYPRDNGYSYERFSTENKAENALVYVGAMGLLADEIQEILNAQKIQTDIIPWEKIKPLSPDFIEKLEKYKTVICLEDGIQIGGAGQYLQSQLQSPVLSIAYPDQFINHGRIPDLHQSMGFVGGEISQRIIGFLKERN